MCVYILSWSGIPFPKQPCICWIFVSGFLHVLWRDLNFCGSDFCFLIFMFYFDCRINGLFRAYKQDLYFNFFNFLFLRKVKINVQDLHTAYRRNNQFSFTLNFIMGFTGICGWGYTLFQTWLLGMMPDRLFMQHGSLSMACKWLRKVQVSLQCNETWDGR